MNSNFHLYASYCTYCEDTGSKPVGQKRFISLLLDCCKNQLGLKEISQFSKKGRPFKNKEGKTRTFYDCKWIKQWKEGKVKKVEDEIPF